MLLLDDLVPIFRKSNQYQIETNNKPNQPLINPHEGLKLTDNGKQFYDSNNAYSEHHVIARANTLLFLHFFTYSCTILPDTLCGIYPT